MQEAVVKKIQDQIIDAEFAHRKHTDHNFQLTDQTDRMVSSLQLMESLASINDINGDTRRDTIFFYQHGAPIKGI